MNDGPAVTDRGSGDPRDASPGFDDLLALLASVAEGVDTLDTLTGDGVDAQENRTIRRSRAWLARSETRQVRFEGGEVRRQARALARSAGDARRRSTDISRQAPPVEPSDPAPTAATPTVEPPGPAPSREDDRLQRLVEGARQVANGVCWAQLVASRPHGQAVWSSGELPPAAVTALERGPRAEILAGAGLVLLDEDDDRWPDLAAAGVPGVLALAVDRGALVLASHDAATFDDSARLVASLLGALAAAALAGEVAPRPHDDDAQVTLDGARAVLGRHLGVGHEETFALLVEIARATGQPVLVAAERLLDALVPRAVAHPPEPAVLRRAMAYVDDHAAEEVSTADIANAAGIGRRGLQGLFRRHHDLTPTQYLHQVRLDRAHEELRAADARSGLTVGRVAERWHFGNPGRFSDAYRTRFGVLPSVTLRS